MREFEINRTFRDPTGDSAVSDEYKRDFLPDYPHFGERRIKELIGFAQRYEAKKQRKLKRRMNYRQRQLEQQREMTQS